MPTGLRVVTGDLTQSLRAYSPVQKPSFRASQRTMSIVETTPIKRPSDIEDTQMVDVLGGHQRRGVRDRGVVLERDRHRHHQRSGGLRRKPAVVGDEMRDQVELGDHPDRRLFFHNRYASDVVGR